MLLRFMAIEILWIVGNRRKHTALIKVLLSLRKILTNAFQDAKAVKTDIKMSSFEFP